MSDEQGRHNAMYSEGWEASKNGEPRDENKGPFWIEGWDDACLDFNPDPYDGMGDAFNNETEHG